MKPRRFLIGSVIFTLCLALVLQPGPSAPIGSWHPRWPKVELPFDGSSPLHALASIAADIPHGIDIGARYVGSALTRGIHAVASLFSSSAARAATRAPTSPGSDSPGPLPGATELTSLRTRDSKTYLNPNGTYTGVFAPHLHYRDSSGAWQNVDLNFYPSGSDELADHNDVAVRVSSTAVQVIDKATGEGISWPTPARASVSGSSAAYTASGLTWTYANTLSGIKLSATVSQALGSRTYTFPYSLLGSAAPLSLDPQGNLVSDLFSIPAPVVYGANRQRYGAGTWSLGKGVINFTFDDSSLPSNALPYQLDPSTIFDVGASGDDGFVDRDGIGPYPPTAPIYVNTTDQGGIVERGNLGGSWYVIRLWLLRWNTASIPDDAAINSAYFHVYVINKANPDSRYLTADWYTAWPIDAADYTATAQTSASGSPGWSAVSGVMNNLPLTGLNNVSKTGYTGLRLHVSGGQPTGDNWMSWGSFDGGGGAQLLVNYAAHPTLDSPIPGATVPLTTPVLKATSDAGDGSAIDYSFQVSNNSSFTGTATCAPAPLTNFTCTSGFLPATNTWTVPFGALTNGNASPYYWRAQARVHSGQTTGWAPSQTFYVHLTNLGSADYYPMWSRGPVSVNQATGNLALSLPGPAYPTAAGSLAASASYNSADTSEARPLGARWTFNAGGGAGDPPLKIVDHSVFPTNDARRYDAAELVAMDGASDFFTHVANTTTYLPPAGESALLRRQPDNTWTLDQGDGSLYTFGVADATTGVAKLTGAQQTVDSGGLGTTVYTFSTSDPTRLTKVAVGLAGDGQRALTFRWHDLDGTCSDALVCIDTPDSLTWKYIGTGSGGTSGSLASVFNGYRTAMVLGYDGTTGLVNKIQNADDIATSQDPDYANLSPGYNQTHAINITYSSGRVATVNEGPISTLPVGYQTPSWSFAYNTGGTTATPAFGAHGPARPAAGNTVLTKPNAATTRTYWDGRGDTMQVTDELGRYTLVSYDSQDRIMWSEDQSGNPTDYVYDNVTQQLLSKTGPDPDGAGPLGRVVTKYRYDEAKIGDVNNPGTPMQGLAASYYANTNLTGQPAGREQDSAVDASWSTPCTPPACPPFLGTQSTNFSASWSGYLYVTQTGNYTFKVLMNDDEVTRLTVNGFAAIDTWNATAPLPESPVSAPISLTGGTLYPISLDYKQGSNNAAVHLRWSCDCGISDQVIPASALRPGWSLQTSTVDPSNRISFHHYLTPASGLADYDLVVDGGLNYITSYAYDSLGRMTQKVMPKGNTGRTIDASGNLTGSPDTAYATTWTYYALGDTATVPSTCGVQTYVNQGGLLKTTQTAGLATITEVYDPAGRIASDTKGKGTTCSYYTRGLLSSDIAPVESFVTSYLYDPAGNKRSSSYLFTVSDEYDEAGQVKTSTDAYGNVTTLTYDRDLNVATKTSMGYQTTYSYDSADELTGLTDARGDAYTFSYDARGMLHTTKYPNSTFSWTDYNAAGWPTAVYNRHGTWTGSPPPTVPGDSQGSPIVEYGYTYKQDGKLASEVRSGGGLTTETTTYTAYDNLGRLAQVSLPSGVARTYSYDRDSNRYQVIDNPGSTTTYTYSATVLDELTQVGSTGLTYTTDGQQSGKGSDTMGWDGRGRMYTATVGGTPVSYYFDPAGQMRQRTSGSSTTRFVYGAGALQYETNGSGTITVSDIAGPAGDLDEYAGAPAVGVTRTYKYYDARGNLGAEADASVPANRTAAYTYDPFGAPLQTQPANSSVERWKGQNDKQYDTALTLIAMGARQYDPSTGRFLSVDPVEGGSLNGCDYGGQDPINNSDLNGLYAAREDALPGMSRAAYLYMYPQNYLHRWRPHIPGCHVGFLRKLSGGVGWVGGPGGISRNVATNVDQAIYGTARKLLLRQSKSKGWRWVFPRVFWQVSLVATSFNVICDAATAPD